MAKEKPRKPEMEPTEEEKVSEGELKMPKEEKPKKIMTQPLPQILDEIEDSIGAADEAAKDARKAAEEARQAGEKAANEAARVASEAIARVEEIARTGLALAELLHQAITEGTEAVQKRLKKGA